jgi:hypothetical protein
VEFTGGAGEKVEVRSAGENGGGERVEVKGQRGWKGRPERGHHGMERDY